MLAPTAVCFHAYLIFDTVGEASGWRVATITSILMIAICLLMMILMHYGVFHYRSRENKFYCCGTKGAHYLEEEASSGPVAEAGSGHRSRADRELSVRERLEEELSYADSVSTISRSKRSISYNFNLSAKPNLSGKLSLSGKPNLSRVYIDPTSSQQLPSSQHIMADGISAHDLKAEPSQPIV